MSLLTRQVIAADQHTSRQRPTRICLPCRRGGISGELSTLDSLVTPRGKIEKSKLPKLELVAKTPAETRKLADLNTIHIAGTRILGCRDDIRNPAERYQEDAPTEGRPGYPFDKFINKEFDIKLYFCWLYG